MTDHTAIQETDEMKQQWAKHIKQGASMTDREVMKMALLTLEGWSNHGEWVWPESALDQAKRNTKEAIEALRQALAQGEPFSLVCPTCSADRTKEACKGDLSNCWLKGQAHSAQPEQGVCAPAGRIVNWSVEDENRLDGAIEKAYGKPEQEHKPWCDYLNIMLTSLPPKRAECNCKQTQPEQTKCPRCGEVNPAEIHTCSPQVAQEPVAWEKSYDIVCSLLRQAHDILATTQYPIRRPWVGLTEWERNYYNNRLSGSGVAEDIEFELRSRNEKN